MPKKGGPNLKAKKGGGAYIPGGPKITQKTPIFDR